MIELNANQVNQVNGGILPGLLWGLGYIGALQVASDFGAGLGRGFYDYTHETP